MRHCMTFLGVAFVVAVLTETASAQFTRNPWADYRLEQNKDAGTWQLYIKASPIGNGGIASYSVPLIGNSITSLDHKSPRIGAAETADGSVSGPVGFTLFRSADGTSEAAKKIAGSQDTISPSPFIIYGFGQTAGNWQTVSGGPVSPLGSNEGNNWSASPLIASGTFTPGGFVKIDRSSVDFLTNLFVSVGSLEVMPAGLVPEPASASMAVMALLSATAIRRRLAAKRF